MKKHGKIGIIACFCGVSALAILSSQSAFAQSRYGTQNHAKSQIQTQSVYSSHAQSHSGVNYEAQYGHQAYMSPQSAQPQIAYQTPRQSAPVTRAQTGQYYRPGQNQMRGQHMTHHGQHMARQGQRTAYVPVNPNMKRHNVKRHNATPRRTAPTRGPVFQRWVETEKQYRFYPGDQLDIVVSSAPELSRTLTVGPDGRISMPMVKPVMAAGRTLIEVQHALRGQLSTQLRDPSVAVTPRAFAPQHVFIGGAVATPGTYTAPGPIGVLEAVIMAGGARGNSNAKQIAVLRRAPNGGMMMRTVNLKKGLKKIQRYDDNMQLRRGDIVFVPRSTLGEIGVFMENFKNALPVDFNLSYQFASGGGGNGTTVITP